MPPPILISDLIRMLEELRAKHGDLPCYTVGDWQDELEYVVFKEAGETMPARILIF